MILRNRRIGLMNHRNSKSVDRVNSPRMVYFDIEVFNPNSVIIDRFPTMTLMLDARAVEHFTSPMTHELSHLAGYQNNDADHVIMRDDPKLGIQNVSLTDVRTILKSKKYSINYI